MFLILQSKALLLGVYSGITFVYYGSSVSLSRLEELSEVRCSVILLEYKIHVNYAEPEAPSSPEVVENIVFLWQPPIKPNGIITGYQIGITYNSSTEGSGKVSPSPEPDAMTFHYVLRKGVIPENVTATITVSETGVHKSSVNILPVYAVEYILILLCR